jgi:hypothetical protein
MKGDGSYLLLSLSQSKFLNQRWDLTSAGPFRPNLLIGFLYINLLKKSAASNVHPSGTSFFLI